jgi:predicted DNA-binding protein
MAKESITIRLRQDLIDRLEAEADEKDVTRSQYIRDILKQRHRDSELQQEIEEIEEQLQSREDRISELEEQLSKRSQIEEKVDTLAKQQQDTKAPFFVQWYQWFKDRE